MKIDVHIYLHDDDNTSLLQNLLEKVSKMSVDMTALTASVAAEDTEIASAITAINGFPAVVAQAVKDALTANGVADAAAQTAADAAAADIQAQTAALTAALAANTPSAPPAPAAASTTK